METDEIERSEEDGRGTEDGRGEEAGKSEEEGMNEEVGRRKEDGRCEEDGRGDGDERGKEDGRGDGDERGKEDGRGDGNERGKEDGRGDGDERGKEDGRGDGVEQGKEGGRGDGDERGKEGGRGDGDERGKEDGRGDGVEQGKEDGRGDGVEQGKEDGRGDGVEQGKEGGRGDGDERGKEDGRGDGDERGKEDGRCDGDERGKEDGRGDGDERGKEDGRGDGVERGKEYGRGDGDEWGKEDGRGDGDERGKEDGRGDGDERGKEDRRRNGEGESKEDRSGEEGEIGEDGLRCDKAPSLKKQVMSECSTKVSRDAAPIQVYQLQLRDKQRDPPFPDIQHDSPFRVYEYGNSNTNETSNRVIMVVGATGAGKTTLINSLINYIFGVEREDDSRFQLIPQNPTSSQSHSQTCCVNSYTLYHQEGSNIPYTLTIIDTPGFGDTGGVMSDNMIFRQIHDFFTSEPQIVDHIDGIGFVVNSTESRLGPTQKYIFDSIMSLFGKDISDNIFLMLTFSDCKDPPILNLIQAANIPFRSRFRFNNSAIFVDMDPRGDSTDGSDDEDNGFSVIYWKLGMNSFARFTKYLGTIVPKSISQTKEVLQARQMIESCMQDIQILIEKCVYKLRQLDQECVVLGQQETGVQESQSVSHKREETQVLLGGHQTGVSDIPSISHELEETQVEAQHQTCWTRFKARARQLFITFIAWCRSLHIRIWSSSFIVSIRSFCCPQQQNQNTRDTVNDSIVNTEHQVAPAEHRPLLDHGTGQPTDAVDKCIVDIQHEPAEHKPLLHQQTKQTEETPGERIANTESQSIVVEDKPSSDQQTVTGDKEIERIRINIMENLADIHGSIGRLKVIALKPEQRSLFDFIDLMAMQAKDISNPDSGWKVREFEKFRNCTEELLRTATDDADPFDDLVKKLQASAYKPGDKVLLIWEKYMHTNL